MNELGQYNGISIQYHASDDTFVNATQMCKATGKQWAAYWRNQKTQEFLEALARELRCEISHLYFTVQGRGDVVAQGTWVHREVALDLAQWCSPEFKVWVIQQINKLMTTGKVILHKEHQEAELALVVPMLHQTLLAVNKSNEMMQKTLTDNERAYRAYVDTMKQIQSKRPEQIEREVERQLVEVEGGVTQIKIENTSHRVDVVIPGKWVIEIKHWKGYHYAIGQVNTYAKYFDVEHDKRIHLFSKPFGDKPSDKRVRQIERECRREGITVTWHEWNIRQPSERQKLLPISY